MNTDNLYRLLEQINQQMEALNESVSILESSLQGLAEENERLKLANQSLIAIFSDNPTSHEETVFIDPTIHSPATGEESLTATSTPQAYVPAHGGSHERLQAIYDEGIHVCHGMFGTKRKQGEGCLLCLDIIDKLA